MAIEVPNKPTSLVEELKIDEDTSFNIYYDITMMKIQTIYT